MLNNVILDISSVNVMLVLIILFIFFVLFMLYSKFFGFTAILLISEAAMVTLSVLILITSASYFPNLSADILNILNASAMEAIVGIVIVFLYHGKWKSRPVNKVQILESGLSIDRKFGVKRKIGIVNCVFFMLKSKTKLLIKKLKIWPIFLILISIWVTWSLAVTIAAYLEHWLFIETVFTEKLLWTLQKHITFVSSRYAVADSVLFDKKQKTVELAENPLLQIYQKRFGSPWKLRMVEVFFKTPTIVIESWRKSVFNYTEMLDNFQINPQNVLNLLALASQDPNFQNQYTLNMEQYAFQIKKLKKSESFYNKNIPELLSGRFSRIIKLINPYGSSQKFKVGVEGFLDSSLVQLRGEIGKEYTNNALLGLFQISSEGGGVERSQKLYIKKIKTKKNQNFGTPAIYKQPNDLTLMNMPIKVLVNPQFLVKNLETPTPLNKLRSTNLNKRGLNTDIVVGKYWEILQEFLGTHILNRLVSPRKFRAVGGSWGAENISSVSLKSPEMGDNVFLKKINSELSWATKNVESLFGHYSRVLPWFEGFDVDSEVYDFSENLEMRKVLSLTEALKIGLDNKNLHVDAPENWGFGKAIKNTEFPGTYNSGFELNDDFSTLAYCSAGLKLEMQEAELQGYSRYLEGVHISKILEIRRKGLGDQFPTNSNRTLNSIGTDMEEFLQGLSYSRGAAENSFFENNFPLEVGGSSHRILTEISGVGYYPKNKRIFSYSTATNPNPDANKVMEISGYGVGLGKRVGKRNKVSYGVYSDEWGGLKHKLKRRNIGQLLGELKQTKIKILEDGNLGTTEIQKRNRIIDLENSKKVVRDRMILPVENLIEERTEDLMRDIPRSYEVPFDNNIKKLVLYNEKFMETKILLPEIKKTVEFNPINFDTFIWKSGISGQKITVDDDLEFDVELSRVNSEKPHTLYGILWDEYLKQAFNTNLQFIDFNSEFVGRYRTNLDKNSKILGEYFKKHIEQSLSPDFRYKFTINDEIKNTLIGKSLAHVGYIKEVSDPEYAVVGMHSGKKKQY